MGTQTGTGKAWRPRPVHRPAVTALQEAYVRNVIDTVNDLDNVLYDICNEVPSGDLGLEVSPGRSHMVKFTSTRTRRGSPQTAPGGD